MDLTKAHALDAKEILAALDVDPEKGLDDLRVEELIERYGPNQINPEEPEPWWKSLLRQFMTQIGRAHV